VYTQCPECGTVFRVTADVLRVAQGEVRCGICSGTFNALEYLSDEAAAHPAWTPSHDDTFTVEESPGHEFIEMETAADESLEGGAQLPESEIPPADAEEHGDLVMLETPAEEWDVESSGIVAVESDPRDTEMVELPSSLAEDDVGDAALEFRGTEEDLARLFVEVGAPRITAVAAAGAADEPAAATGAAPGESVTLAGAAPAEPDDLEHGAEGLVEADLMELPQAAEAFADAAPVEEPDVAPTPLPVEHAEEPAELVPLAHEAGDFGGASSLDRTDEFPILVLDESDEDRTAAERGTHASLDGGGYEPPPPIPIPPELRAAHAIPATGEGAAAAAVFEQLGLREERRERIPALWLAAVVVLVLALAVQLVHYNRDALARHAIAGPLLARAYAALGIELTAPVDLAAFEVRQWGAATDAAAPGTLRMRASIANRATFPQPYPLLRLALQDRFGNTVGVRDLQPQEYLPGRRGRERLLGAGQRADAEVSIVDPGAEAVGFELDVCVPAGAAVRCAGDARTR
jgi:predicted Zn finger-like uncharacterized protein